MFRIIQSGVIVLIFFIVFLPSATNATKIAEVEIKGEINEGSVILLEEAFKQDADVVLIVIDTPGGLLSSMQKMVQQILESDKPVITYVYPQGAFAASAGSFILISGHIAVMSNGTATGAATPIGIFQPAENKTINFVTKFGRSIAEERGRPVNIVEEFVTEGRSLSAKEAYEYRVIDLLVDSKEELFQRIDGKNVTVKGRNITLSFDKIEIIKVEKPLRSRIFEFLSNPQIASILLLIGIYGLIFGLTSPGILPETIGAICLVLSLFGLGMMNISYIAILLFVLGILFLVAELMTPTYGVLGIASIVCVTLGALMLFDEPLMPKEFYSSFPKLISGISIGLAGIMTFLIVKVVQLRKFERRVGGEAIIGETGTVISFEDKKGFARVRGEVWEIESEGNLKEGDKIKVRGRDGLRLYVEKVNDDD